MAHKLDIFETLSAIDRRNLAYLDDLDEDRAKGFAPPVVLRWASAVEHPDMAEWYLAAVNENANVRFNDLYEYPDLQFRLMASCGTGRTYKHAWIGGAKSRGRSDKLFAFLWRFYPQANEEELRMLVGKHTPATFAEFVADTGCGAEEAKEVLKVYGEVTGTRVKAAKKPKRAN